MTRPMIERVVIGCTTGISIVMSVGALAVVEVDGGNLLFAEELGSVMLATSFAIVGALIAARSGNLIGWLMLASGFFGSLNALSGVYSQVALERGWPLQPVTAWVDVWDGAATALMFPIILLLFPTGRPPSRGWWIVAIAAVAAAGIGTIPASIDAWTLSSSMELTGDQLSERVGRGGVAARAVLGLAMVAATASLVIRYRRGSFLQRQQLKWLLWAAGLFVLILLTLSPAAPVGVADRLPLVTAIAVLGLPAIPVAIAIAVLRYRLYDIDAVINRTLVYAALTGLLALAYVGLVFVLGELARPLTRESDLAVAGSTLAVAALFRPLRDRVQAFIDQRFYRRKYDAVQTLGEFGARLRDQVDLESLSRELVRVVGSTMQPAHASLWLRPPPEGATP